MVDHSRLEDLRRRVQKDPASIAFAQLAEECRRAGQFQEAVDTCRSGLSIHPGYLSARVTLGRALAELGQLDEAQAEFEFVLKNAPENLAAIRGLAEIHYRRGQLGDALTQYQAALALARNDPDLAQTVEELTRQVEPAQAAPVVVDGLSLEQMRGELLTRVPPQTQAQPLVLETSCGAPMPPEPTGKTEDRTEDGTEDNRRRRHMTLTVAALERYLAAIHVARASRRA
jgi:tetratricopeptide (TPR) repeat protein